MNFFKRLGAAVERYDGANNFTCDLCGREVFSGERICLPCSLALPRNNGHVCPFCGRKVREPGTCLECKAKPLKTDKARSVCLHEGDAARLVLQFKNGKKYLKRAMCELLLPLVKEEFPDADLLAFVPMTEAREKKRGYNQSRLVAEELSAQTGIALYCGVQKTRETQEQKTLSRRDREDNLEGCFHVSDRKGVRGKRILIIDDTLTTGATTSELARVLKNAGAEMVYAATVTSVENKNPFGLPPIE